MRPGSIYITLLLLAGTAYANDDRERNLRVVEIQHTEIWSKGRIELIPDIYTSDFEGHFPGGLVHGYEGIREMIINHRQAFPDWTEKVIDIITERDRVVTRFISRGTNLGSFLGEKPTGKSIEISEVSIYRMKDGKIAEQWVYPDMRSMQKQLYGKSN